jgi:hypothetical protein
MIFKKFHIFIRPSGDVLIVVKNLYYLIDFPSFNVKSGYNGQSFENLGIPKEKRIDAIFRTYSGKTYIFYAMPMSTSSNISLDENDSFFEFKYPQDFVYELPTGKLVTKI